MNSASEKAIAALVKKFPHLKDEFGIRVENLMLVKKSNTSRTDKEQILEILDESRL